MDINLMVLNVGNSRLAIGIFHAGELEHVTRIAHTEKARWPAAIAEAWKKIAETDDPAVAGLSVNPPLLESLEHVVNEQTDQAIQWIGKEIPLPIKVLTQQPAETGVDRIVNMAAAYEQMGKACVVVDAGTAITVDCCNDNGEFLGGAIAPGLSMLLNVLHEKTAKLPLVKFEIPVEPFGTSTDSAICQGIYHGIRGMVRELVENYATKIGIWPEIIATGGDAAQLFQGWELIHAVSPDLTLYGTALAYANHLDK